MGKEKKIYSENAAFQKFEVLRTNRNKRHRYGEFLVEGVRNINGALKYGWKIVSLIYPSDVNLSDWAAGLVESTETEENFVLTGSLMKKLSGKTDTSELLAIVKMREDNFQDIKLPSEPVILLFDRPSNKGNLGTVIRSCDALGVDAVFVTGHSVDIYDPEVIASSIGSFFKVPVMRINGGTQTEDLISDLRVRYPGLRGVATTSHNAVKAYEADMRPPLLFMLGNETDGLCRSLYELADIKVTIPMADSSYATSFNAACAATTIMYEITRQRNICGQKKI